MNNLTFKVITQRSNRPLFADYDLLTMTLRIQSKPPTLAGLWPTTAAVTQEEYGVCQNNFVPIWTNLSILSSQTVRTALAKLLEDLTYALNTEFTIPSFIHTVFYAGSYNGADRLPDRLVDKTPVNYAAWGVHQINYWSKDYTHKLKLNLIQFLKDMKSPSVIALESHINHYHEDGGHTCDIEVALAVKSAIATEGLDGQPLATSFTSYPYRHLYTWFNLFSERSQIAKNIFFYDTNTLEDKVVPVALAYSSFNPTLKSNMLATLKRALSYFQETIYAIKTPIIKTLKEALRVANLLPVRKSN